MTFTNATLGSTSAQNLKCVHGFYILNEQTCIFSCEEILFEI